jgi:hypothetical protein
LAPFSGSYEAMTLMGDWPQTQLDNVEEARKMKGPDEVHSRTDGWREAAAFRRIIYHNLLIPLVIPPGGGNYDRDPSTTHHVSALIRVHLRPDWIFSQLLTAGAGCERRDGFEPPSSPARKGGVELTDGLQIRGARLYPGQPINMFATVS